MKHAGIFVVLIFLFGGCAGPSYPYPHVVIETDAGKIELELYTDKAPLTAKAFLSYADAGFYKHSNFYRVLRDDNQPSDAPKANLIQGGLWKTDYQKASTLPGIPHEPTSKTGVLHRDGIISLARMEPGTATTEFFICIGNQPGFDFGGDNNADGQGYAAFGKVVKGMNIVHRLYDRSSYGQAFDPPIVIINITKL
jgi:peptidyl-prolyl cis-trans isomerase A (cyclophilin A)